MTSNSTHLPRRLTRLAALLATATLMGGGALAWAGTSGGIPGSDGVIHGCYDTTSPLKTLHLLDPAAGTRCPTGTTAIAFNQTGPVGPAGPVGPPGAQGTPGVQGPQGIQGDTGTQGLTGATGPAGPAGTTGVSGYEIVTTTTSGMNTGDTATATCPTHKHALSGSGEILSDGLNGGSVMISGGAPTIGGIGWEITTTFDMTPAWVDAISRGNDFFTDANQLTLQVWVVCATTTP